MLIFGHTGIATGAVHAIDRRADLRWVPLAALLPDLVDKPLWLLAPGFTNGWTRNAAHSLTGLAVFTLFVAWTLREKAWPLILAYASHLVLDQMWLEGHILVWPLGGFIFPQFTRDHVELWWEKFSDLWTMGGEAVGGAILIGLTVRGRLWDPERRRSFRATGRLA